MEYSGKEKIPGWARGIDDFGKKRWRRDHPTRTKRGEYIANAVVNLIFLWIVNKVPEWNPDFIRESYMVVLWALNMSIIIQAGGNLLMAFVESAPVRYLSRIIMESASFIVQILLYYIYPFDFSHYPGLLWLDWFIPLVLIFGMVISALKVLTNLWKLVFWR